ncbi:putative reverse transcriptase domain-containing protein [Tanacetum coccineum]
MVASRPSLPSRSSPHDTLAPSSEFPLALVVAPPRIRRWPSILVQPGEAIPFDRPYHTYPNGPRKLLNARKRVGPFPARRLVMRLLCIEGLHHCLLLTYQRHQSHLSIHLLRGHWIHLHLLLDHLVRDADPLLLRFRDSYSPEDSGEEHLEIATANAEAVPDLGIGDGVGAHIEDGTGIGVEVATSDIREDEEKFKAEASAGGTMEITLDPLVIGGISESTGGDVPNLEGTLCDIAHYMSEFPLDRITEFETAQRQLEAGQLVASEERAGLVDRVRSLGRENLRVRALLCIERDRVDSLRRHMRLSQEEFRQICRDHNDTRRRLRRLESLVERTMTNTRSGMTPAAIEEMINRRMVEALETREANRNIRLGNDNGEGGNGNGNGNGNGGGNRNGNHNENDRDARPRTIGTDAEFAMSWREIIKLMVEVYYPRTKIQKMESELWNLTMKNNDLATYTKRLQELTMLYTKMVPEEED